MRKDEAAGPQAVPHSTRASGDLPCLSTQNPLNLSPYIEYSKAEIPPVGKRRSSHMDEPRTPSDNLDQTDEDIFTPTVSDGALEAAAGFEGRLFSCHPPLASCW